VIASDTDRRALGRSVLRWDRGSIPVFAQGDTAGALRVLDVPATNGRPNSSRRTAPRTEEEVKETV